MKAHKKGSNDIDFDDLADYYDYYPDTIFFREDFGANQIMGTRWKMFLKKITAKQSILFSEVVHTISTDGHITHRRRRLRIRL